ncbi:MAG TPA: hypothetical protein VGD69_25640 [Herpetosiphonaceae bacterium]
MLLRRRFHALLALLALLSILSTYPLAQAMPATDNPTLASPQTITTAGSSIELVSSLGGDVAVLDVEGSLAYINEGLGLAIIDSSDPAQPSRRSYLQLPDVPLAADVAGTTAYIADSNAGLQIVDVSNPDSPHLLGGYPLPATTLDVQIVGNLAYVLGGLVVGQQAVYVLDIGAPSQPVLRGKYDLSLLPTDFEMEGALAYMVFGNGGLQIVDLSNPASPVLRGSYPFPNNARTVAVNGNRAYVGDSPGTTGQGHLTILDVSNPASPALLGTYNTAAFIPTDLQVAGNLAYLLNSSGTELRIVDVSNPASPALRGQYNPPATMERVRVVNNRAYLTMQRGMEIVDVSDPGSPSLRGSYNPPWYIDQVDSAGSLVYIVSLWGGMHIVDASDLARPRLRGFYPGTIYDLQIAGNLAYLATSSAFQIVDVGNPDAPTLLSSRALEAVNVVVRGSLAYVHTNAGLTIFDVADPSDPTTIGSYGTQFTGIYATGLDVAGDFAYLTSRSCLHVCGGGLEIVDVSDPSNPALRGVYEQYADGVDVVGDRAYIIHDQVDIVDVSNPGQPTLSGTYHTPNFAKALHFHNGRTYIADGWGGGLHIADLITADHLRPRVSFKTLGDAQAVDVEGTIVYLAEGDGGLKIFRVHPELFPSDIFVPIVGKTS